MTPRAAGHDGFDQALRAAPPGLPLALPVLRNGVFGYGAVASPR